MANPTPPDESGTALIRGIDIDKLAKGFAEEQYVMKSSCTVTPTSAREIRWYSRTKGVLGGTTTTGITGNLIGNVGERAQPSVVERDWTRNTNYVRKYFVESPTISMEDIKDADPDILATNIRDLTMAVSQQVDFRILDSISGATGINTLTVDSGWILPIEDILSGASLIQSDFYKGTGLDIIMTPNMYRRLMVGLISTAGSSIPGFSSEKVRTGVVMSILGHNIKTSTQMIDGSVLWVTPQKTCTWKTFMPITARTVEEVGIGTKIRVWEEGEAICTDPESACYFMFD